MSSSLLAGPALDLLLAISAEQGWVFCCKWFYCWELGTGSNVVQLSGPDGDPVLEENLSFNEVKQFIEEGSEAKRHVRAVFNPRMWI